LKSPFSPYFFRAALIILLFGAQSPLSALDVSGNLTSGVWSLSDHPVRVVGNIVLPTGEQLTIQPGVRVEFAGPFSFTVNGKLIAEGTYTDFIVFTVANPMVDSLRWRGLRLDQAERDTRFRFCRIEYGWARGAWPDNCGGGVYIKNCSPTLERCEIINNRADLDGGGLYGWSTSATLRNNLIVANWSGNFGGGVSLMYSNPTIANCTVTLDTARGWGGGVFIGTEGKPNISNSIITANTQLLFLDDQIENNDLPRGDNFMQDLGRAQSARPVVSFSDVTVGQDYPFPGTGNISADPQFVNAVRQPYDFRLKYSSPCIDAGDPRLNASTEPDILINRLNLGHHGGTELATKSVPVFYNMFDANNIVVNFDSIRINTRTSQEIRIENRGHYRLYVHEFRFSNPDFFPDSTVNDSGRLIPSFQKAPIEPGESGKCLIQFRPGALRNYNDTLTIITSDTLYGVDTLHPANLNPLRRHPRLILRGGGIDPIARIEDSLDFGRRQIGTHDTLSLWLFNIGRSRLLIRSISLPDTIFDVTADTNIVDRGDSLLIKFIFLPAAPQVYESAISLRTNDRNLYITLTGRGFGPRPVIADTSKYVGYVWAGGDTIVSYIPIKNVGDEPLVISNVVFTPVVGPPGAFSAVIGPGGFIIPPDSTGLLPVNFHPNTVNQDYNYRLTIMSNYPLGYNYRLLGRGMAAPGRYMFGEAIGVWDWSVGSADYIILDSVTVPAHERLRIMPGARILFERRAFIRANGELRAVGLPTDSIYFLPRDDSGTPAARWKGLELNNEDGSRLIYCVVRSGIIGVKVRHSSPVIQFSTITACGDSAGLGGGLYIENSGLYLAGCIIDSNYARYGGGIYILNSKPFIANCQIRDNSAASGGGLYFRFLSSALLQSNLIYRNRAASNGGGLAIVENSSPRLINNTIVDNYGDGIYAAIRSVPSILNSIIYGHTDSSITRVSGANALVSYCDVEGGFAHPTNIDIAPGFAVNAGLPYELNPASPLIDRGNPERPYRDYSFPPSQGTSRNDIGAYGGTLGGGWQAPDIAINLYQNSAFPQWLDVMITSLAPFAGAPVCSLEFGGGSLTLINLTAIDQYVYRGKYEAPGSGPIFITSEADITGGQHQKVGRDFELILATTREGADGALPGVGGRLIIPPSAVERTTALICRYEPAPECPTNELIFITPTIEIKGLTHLAAPARIEMTVAGLTTLPSQNAAVYRLDNGIWLRLAGECRDDKVVGMTDRGGKFAVALGSRTFDDEAALPMNQVLMSAYPNPFNNVTLIKYTLPQAGKVRLGIYNLSGRQVAQLEYRQRGAGEWTAQWDGLERPGQPAASGIYWAKLETPYGDRALKLLLVR